MRQEPKGDLLFLIEAGRGHQFLAQDMKSCQVSQAVRDTSMSTLSGTNVPKESVSSLHPVQN